jgi:hypothetical protein
MATKTKRRLKKNSVRSTRRRKATPKVTSTDTSTQKPLTTRTAEDISNEQTAEQLALRIWAAKVGQKVLKDMSSLMDDLLQSHLLDDDDEEADEGWLDEQQKSEKKLLDEAIADELDQHPDFAAISNLPPNADPDIAKAAVHLKEVLQKCAVGATKLKGRF